ncbi:SET domain-containing protein-lysine N-methyltransferase [Candidatus Dependentiae bacterium]|nr:SET domain-containing protein-lysine N-methyltransferase [Candidatus Dependentiae bacterium]
MKFLNITICFFSAISFLQAMEKSQSTFKYSSFLEKMAVEVHSRMPEQYLADKRTNGYTYRHNFVLGRNLEQFGSLVTKDGFDPSLVDGLQGVSLESLPRTIATTELPKLCVKKVDGRMGYGVVALQDIAPGTLIRAYSGIIEQTLEFKEYGTIFKNFGHAKASLIVNAEKEGNESRFFNHSYAPNCQGCFVVDAKSGKVQFWIQALHPIYFGEEICWNYGSGYWKSKRVVPIEKNGKILLHNEQDALVLCSLKEYDGYFVFFNDSYVKSGDEYLLLDADAEYLGAEAFSIPFNDDKQCKKIIAVAMKSRPEDSQIKFNLFQADKQNRSLICMPHLNEAEQRLLTARLQEMVSRYRVIENS